MARTLKLLLLFLFLLLKITTKRAQLQFAAIISNYIMIINSL